MALQVIIDLLATHGQGGLCTEDGLTYHNSFLICDRKEAWILETAGNIWVAEQITGGWKMKFTFTEEIVETPMRLMKVEAIVTMLFRFIYCQRARGISLTN